MRLLLFSQSIILYCFVGLTASTAQNLLSTDIRSALEEAILTDGQKFEQTNLLRLRNELEEYYWQERTDGQIPTRVWSLPPETRVNVFYVPGCQGSGFENLGIRNGDLDSREWGPLISELQLERAFANESVSIDLSERQAGLLFGHYGRNENGYGPGPNQDDHIFDFNSYLVERFASGGLPQLFLLFEGDLCGGGGFQISFKISEGYTQAMLIPEFFFEICEARFGTALDFQSCRWWSDVENSAWMSGVYVWSALDPSGQLVMGRKNMDRVEFEEVIQIP